MRVSGGEVRGGGGRQVPGGRSSGPRPGRPRWCVCDIPPTCVVVARAPLHMRARACTHGWVHVHVSPTCPPPWPSTVGDVSGLNAFTDFYVTLCRFFALPPWPSPQSVMTEPALLVSPQLAAAPSYERRAIEAWLQHKKWVVVRGKGGGGRGERVGGGVAGGVRSGDGEGGRQGGSRFHGT